MTKNSGGGGDPAALVPSCAGGLRQHGSACGAALSARLKPCPDTGRVSFPEGSCDGVRLPARVSYHRGRRERGADGFRRLRPFAGRCGDRFPIRAGLRGGSAVRRDGRRRWSGDGAGRRNAAASRCWAGFLALANQQAAANGKLPIGFINPTIYPIGESSNYLTDFNEIAGGSNGGYSVVTGEYNMVTGWGSPKGQNLINALTAAPPPPSCTATPECIGSGNFGAAVVMLSCNGATQISTSATLCGLQEGGCGTNNGPSGILTSSTAGYQGEVAGGESCTLNWCWGGNCYQQRLTPP